MIGFKFKIKNIVVAFKVKLLLYKGNIDRYEFSIYINFIKFLFIDLNDLSMNTGIKNNINHRYLFNHPKL